MAVEEHFYIGIAILFVLVSARKPNHSFEFIPIAFFVLSAFCLFNRVLASFVHPVYAHQTHLFATHLRIDSLFYGVLLSYLVHFRDLQSRIARIPSSALLIVGILLFAPAFILQRESDAWITVFGVVFFYIGGGMLVLAATRLNKSDSTILQFLGSLGAASYSIYLWHMAINTWGYKAVQKVVGFDSFTIYFLVYIFGACVFGWTMNRLIEHPILMVRNRLYPKD